MTPLRRCKATLLTTTVLSLTCVVLGGCGDGKPSVDTSKTEATVSGTVKVKGKPAEGGVIMFNPSNSERIASTRSVQIGKDGSYKITTFTGGNQVSFDGDIAKQNQGVGLIKEYVDVKSGSNTADFDLMGEGGGKKAPYSFQEKGKNARRPVR
jgi:hypothetical protein